MRDRLAPWIVLSVAVGIGLGWILASLRPERGPQGPPSYATDLDPRPTAPPEPRPPHLEGLPPVEPEVLPSPSRGPGPDSSPMPGVVPPEVVPPEVIEWMGPEDWEWVDESWLLGQGLGTDREKVGWNALLTLYALGGRAEDFLRAVEPAMEGGLDTGSVLTALQYLPAEDRVTALDRLRADLPEAGWPTDTLVSIYHGAGASEQALALIEEAVARGEVTWQIASTLVAIAPERVEALLGPLAARGELDHDLIEIGARGLIDGGRAQEAIPYLLQLLSAEPLRYSALSLLMRADESLALDHVQRLTSENPSNADPWNWLGNLYMERGDNAAAFEAYREAAAREFSTTALYGMLRADPEAAYDAAAPLVEHSEDDEAIGAFAKVAVRSGRFEEALEILRRAHQFDPSDHEWMRALVDIDPAGSIPIFEETLRTYEGGSRDEVLGALGNALRESGNPSAAFEQFREAFELDPSDWEWQRGMARADPARALPLLEQQRLNQGDDGDLLGAIADAHAGLGNDREALAFYIQAYESGGGEEWLGRMGQVDPDEAIRRIQTGLDANPSHGDLWGYLGDVYRAMGEIEQARSAYDQARTHSPTSIRWETRYRSVAN